MGRRANSFQLATNQSPGRFNTYTGTATSRRTRGTLDIFAQQGDQPEQVDAALDDLVGLNNDDFSWSITIIDGKRSRMTRVGPRARIDPHKLRLELTTAMGFKNSAHTPSHHLYLDTYSKFNTDAYSGSDTRLERTRE